MLTSRGRFDPNWLRAQLANPPRAAVVDEAGARMPDLDLSSAEIDALVAFLNADGPNEPNVRNENDPNDSNDSNDSNDCNRLICLRAFPGGKSHL